MSGRDELVALYRRSESHRQRAVTEHVAGGAGRCIVCGLVHRRPRGTAEDWYPPPREPWIRVGPRRKVKAHHAGVGLRDWVSLYWNFWFTYCDSRWCSARERRATRRQARRARRERGRTP